MRTQSDVKNRFYELLPDRPWCKAHKSGKWMMLKKEEAIGFPLIQPNHPNVTNWITVDLDNEDSGTAFERVNLPPNLMVCRPIYAKDGTPVGARSHYLYLLDRPVTEWKNSRPSKVTRYVSRIRRGLTHGLQGDFAYNGQFVKSPFYKDWVCNALMFRPYRLDEIAKHVDMDLPVGVSQGDLGRNCAIFESLRFWSYRNLKRFGCFDSFHLEVSLTAESLNVFEYPLPQNEVSHIAKSVAKWTWSRYEGEGGCRRGIMNLDKELPLEARQSLAGAFSSRLRTQTTLKHLSEAVRGLYAGSEKITQKTVSSRARVSIATTKRHWVQVNEMIESLKHDSPMNLQNPLDLDGKGI